MRQVAPAAAGAGEQRGGDVHHAHAAGATHGAALQGRVRALLPARLPRGIFYLVIEKINK